MINQMNKNAKLTNKILVLVMTGFILAVLIFSAPANSYILSITSDKTDVSKGGEISFNTGVSIGSSESSNVERLSLTLMGLNGARDYSCVFDVNGAVLSGCEGMIIRKTSDLTGSSYGYGYGYGYGTSGTLGYRITLDTTDYNTGDYRIMLNVSINGNSYVQNGQIITINTRNGQGNSYEIFSSGNHYYVSDKTLDVYNSYDKICLNAWKCTEWSQCTNGEKTRTCGQTMADCLMSPKPAESQKCAITLTKPDYYNEIRVIDSQESQSESLTESRIGITGAVIGAKDFENSLIIALILLIAIVIGLILGIILARSIRRQRRIRQLRRLNQVRYRPLRQ